jgi:hypothetical protein
MSDLELMEIHVHVLFEHDDNGRLTVLNEPPKDIAPLVFIGTTRLGSVIRYSNTLDAKLVEGLEKAFDTEPDERLGKVLTLVNKERPIHDVWFGPAYVFPSIEAGTCPRITQVTNENKEILQPLFPYTFEDFDYKQPCYVIIEDNMPVSICCSARQTSRAAEASLFTHGNYRGRGYGVDVAKAWAAEVQKQGRLALYSTSWNNFASRAVAKKLQLIEHGTDFHIG